jgi:two-component system, chemotaxis family, chemotaxis protein CheY
MTTILLVDDDPVNQRIMDYILRKGGYTVRLAGNGVEGLAALAEMPVELVILDNAMPGMDGLSMLRHVRADPATRSVPVIMLTSSGDDCVFEEAEGEHIQGYLTKPSSSRTILALIRQVLKEAD